MQLTAYKSEREVLAFRVVGANSSKFRTDKNGLNLHKYPEVDSCSHELQL